MTRASKILDQFVVAVVMLICWQLVSLKLGGNAVPRPLDTIERLSELCATWVFWGHAVETGRAVLLAALLATFGGVLLGLCLGLSRFSSDVAAPVLVAVYALPKVVLYPLVLLIFGLSVFAKVALGFLNGFAPVTIVAMEAVRNVSPTIVRTAKVMHLSRWDTVFRVLLPDVLPEILTGVRVGVALTIVGVLIGEIFASNKGLGFVLTNASQLNDNLTVMALTLFIVLASLGVNWLIAALSPSRQKGRRTRN